MKIRDEAKVDFYDKRGKALCMDYRGEKKAAKAGSVIPHYPEMDHVSGEKDKTLILRVYPGEGEYLQYQDNGEDFAYREGAYNLYRILWKDGQVSVKPEHQRYASVYEKILVQYGDASLSETIT